MEMKEKLATLCVPLIHSVTLILILVWLLAWINRVLCEFAKGEEKDGAETGTNAFVYTHKCYVFG